MKPLIQQMPEGAKTPLAQETNVGMRPQVCKTWWGIAGSLLLCQCALLPRFASAPVQSLFGIFSFLILFASGTYLLRRAAAVPAVAAPSGACAETEEHQEQIARLMEELERSKSFLKQTGEVAGIGGWELDCRTLKLSWTEETCRIHGVPPDYQPTLESGIEFYSIQSRSKIEKAVRDGMEHGTPWDLELAFVRADGRPIWVRAAGQAHYEDGKIVRLFGILQDVTARRRVEDELRETNEHLETATLRANEMALQAQLASAAKSEFLASMSHEIRTPMNGILGFTHLLMETPMTEEQRDYTLTLQRSGEALLSLINDILDYSKIEAGKLTLEIVTCDLRFGCAEAVELMSAQAQAKELDLVLNADPHAIYVNADPCRVRQILFNLVGNALKFTRKGHVMVSLESCPASGSAPGSVRINISDTGIGIPPEKLGLLFNKFSQVDVSTTRKFGGTGLGLAICKQLVEMMGGRIGVESTPGLGSTFWFTLPLATVNTEFFLKPQPAFTQNTPNLHLPPIAASTAFPAELASLKILLVESNDASRMAMIRLFQSWGTRYDATTDASHAMQKLRAAAGEQVPHDVVLFDERLMGAYLDDWVSAMKSVSTGKPPFLVLLRISSSRAVSQGDESISIPHAILNKPVTRPDALVEVLRQSLRTTTTTPRSRPQTPDLASLITVESTSTSTSTPGVGAEGTRNRESEKLEGSRLATPVVRVLLAEDNLVNQKLAIRLLSKCGCEVEVASNGIEALKLVSERSYQIIFMDCQMPEMDGFEATTELRRREQQAGLGAAKGAEGGPGRGEPMQYPRRIPVIALTANAMAGDRDKCLRVGMDDYLSKPLKVEELRATVEKWRRLVLKPTLSP